MNESVLNVGEKFPVHFVWHLDDGDYLRAVFPAEILELDWSMERYVLRLGPLQAGRQEAPNGEVRPDELVDRENVDRLHRISGRRLKLAFEVADGRPILLRLPTLTGEHKFFFRLDPL